VTKGAVSHAASRLWRHRCWHCAAAGAWRRPPPRLPR
jgi:hypothetical protein